MMHDGDGFPVRRVSGVQVHANRNYPDSFRIVVYLDIGNRQVDCSIEPEPVSFGLDEYRQCLTIGSEQVAVGNCRYKRVTDTSRIRDAHSLANVAVIRELKYTMI
ncbi:MAG: hypothetical protein WC613_04585 [Candidatus Aenigmatarchaeota archaeon]